MAIRHLITGSFITLLLLGGCGSVPDTDAGSADAGSAPQQAVIVDRRWTMRQSKTSRRSRSPVSFCAWTPVTA